MFFLFAKSNHSLVLALLPMPTTVLLQACRDAQRNEVDVLQSIFTHELTVAHTRPFCMRVIVALDDIDCRVRVFVCFVLSCNALRSFWLLVL